MTLQPTARTRTYGGTWVFYVGPTGFNNTLDCSRSFEVKRAIRVELLYPDGGAGRVREPRVLDDHLQPGLRGGGPAPANTSPSPTTPASNKTLINRCGSTLPGWSHDLMSRNWACYYGEKITTAKEFGKKVTVPLEAKLDLQRKYVPSEEFVSKINGVQSPVGGNPATLRCTAGLWETSRGELEDSHRQQPHDLRLLSYRRSSERLPANSPTPLTGGTATERTLSLPSGTRAQCGSCYAFASMAMMESRLRILTNNSLQVVLSPQDVVGCSEYSQGCEGGFPYLIAGKYAQDFGAVEESCFPYQGVDTACNEKKGCMRYYATNYYYVGGYYGACSEPLMRLELVNNGPIAVGFEVLNDFLNYKGGIYRHTGLTDKFNPWVVTNHAVLVVGYGIEAGVPFWIVKNSWGEDWGEQGYFRILRGVDEVGIESMALATTPLVP